MTKPPSPGQCIHCLESFQTLTWDHVLPVSWYPDTTPENLEKWKVPACLACNKRLGKVEEDLRDILALCMDPGNARASGITDKVLKSMDPSSAHSDRERRARLAKQKRILSSVTESHDVPNRGVFPGFGQKPGLDYGNSYKIVWIPEALLDQFNEKLIRGVTYKLNDQAVIDPGFTIRRYHVVHGNEPVVDAMLAEKGIKELRGPGLEIQYARSGDFPAGGMMKVVIWGQYILYGVVSRMPFPEKQNT